MAGGDAGPESAGLGQLIYEGHGGPLRADLQRFYGELLPTRRVRTRPRVVKRAISKYNARGTVDRTSYKATITVDILTTRTT
ncbi:hypothetical protein GCM10010421_09950 [Streptomyces glaucus]|uniref:Transposase n=1 Tax=Streptomyces glaucus TaxID=284029 RepID=A0ABN3JBN1_9ACTN